jgi:hypothetical protein
MLEIKKAALASKNSDNTRYDLVIKQQDQLIRKLQKALRDLIGDKDFRTPPGGTSRNLKRPNETFYKE